MALEQKSGSGAKTLVKYTNEHAGLIEKKQNVLNEDVYTEGIEKIITRDFFPDLLLLHSQAEYFEALEKNDLVKLREIQLRCRQSTVRPNTGASSVYNTPATFETPDRTSEADIPSKQSSSAKGVDDQSQKGDEHDTSDESRCKKMRLDKYLSQNTSEDNVSFSELLVEGERKRIAKQAWMYNMEDRQQEEHEKKLSLPSVEGSEQEKGTVDTWKYTPINPLMYVPGGTELSAKEIIEQKKDKPRAIIHANTRFHLNPFDLSKNKQLMHVAASNKALSNVGKIGHDGKEMVPIPSPRVNGYGFMGTPSPMPGVEDSPFMTWGEVESTPYRLDGSETPSTATPGRVFKIPDFPHRDQIALDLAEKASRSHRAKKQEAIKQVTRNLVSPRIRRGTTERLNSMSPAAQRLANKYLGIRTNTDKALRSSYTPSPSHRLPGDKTPIMRTTPRTTPKSLRTPGSTPGSTPGTPQRRRGVTSLTDDLLQLPKTSRSRAADFF